MIFNEIAGGIKKCFDEDTETGLAFVLMRNPVFGKVQFYLIKNQIKK